MNMSAKMKTFFEKFLLKFFSKPLFYINGPDNLPPPLSKEEEEEAFLGAAMDKNALAKALGEVQSLSAFRVLD